MYPLQVVCGFLPFRMCVHAFERMIVLACTVQLLTFYGKVQLQLMPLYSGHHFGLRPSFIVLSCIRQSFHEFASVCLNLLKVSSNDDRRRLAHEFVVSEKVFLKVRVAFCSVCFWFGCRGVYKVDIRLVDRRSVTRYRFPFSMHNTSFTCWRRFKCMKY